jgi:hypothetical protein
VILLTDLFGHFSTVELLWSAAALAGLFCHQLNYRETKRDMAALGTVRNGRWRIARGNLRRERVRLGISGMFLVFGVLAGLTPPNPNATLSSLIISVGLTFTSALLALNSYYDRRDRLYLLHFRSDERPETLIEQEDREVGDTRRGKQAENDSAPRARKP